jgi:hypothetical protein
MLDKVIYGVNVQFNCTYLHLEIKITFCVYKKCESLTKKIIFKILCYL